ncbi:MAG: RCC1 repeat-containing protein, partial [Nitrospirae bacterium]|nr:RCC1 repeat-containing protein [Nitrospirota bacterium]
SDSAFTISGGGGGGGTTSITVTSPNGGESWAPGSTQAITWSYTGSPGANVRILLYNGTALSRSIATSAPIGSGGSGSYNWAIPSGQAVGSNYKIRIMSTTSSAYNDMSDNTFSISNAPPTSITVTSPNGGESWAPGSTQAITWTSAGTPGANVKIELYKGGVFSSSIIASTATAGGSYNWAIPADQASGSDYTVKITSTTNGTVSDTSDSNFTIFLGSAWTWGDNSFGQLGDGTYNSSNIPVQVDGLTGGIAIAGGWDHTAVVKSDGTVVTWGDNTYGQLGNGTTTDSTTPVQVSGLNNAVAVAVGDFHTAAVTSGGTVVAWGLNNYGQLGNGTTTGSTTPVQASGLVNIVAVSAGMYHTAALKVDGTVWIWGRNNKGQLGNGTTTDSNIPVQVSGFTGVEKIAAGQNYTVALKSDGTVWSWGYNADGQLGNGTHTDSNIPVQVTVAENVPLENVIGIAAGVYHTVAVKSDGTVWTWGNNLYGQLGNGTYDNSAVPVQVSSLNAAVAVAAGQDHSAALKNDGTVMTWGDNTFGQLGDGTDVWDSNVPVSVSGLSDVFDIAAGPYHTAIVK